MICKYCNKECKNVNSLKQHEVRCNLNSNKIKSSFIEYNKKVTDGLIKKNTNQYTKAIGLGIDKPKMSDETKKKISLAAKKQIWTDERKNNHSITMLKTVEKYPKSYSINNVSGRTKTFVFITKNSEKIKLKGKWELIVATYLENMNINWTNNISEIITYEWDNKVRRYFPDFYIIDQDIYIEVKGFQRDRDIEKWNALKNRLLIIKKNDIKNINLNNFNIFEKISALNKN